MQKFREELSSFLSDLDSAEPVELDSEKAGVDDEEEALADVSRLLEEGEEGAPDAQIEDDGDELSHRSPVLARRARTESSAVNGVPFNLEEQLRLLAVHDCPHCECCSGSLLVV
ncbi:unnamed protein product [Dibothriocephalus latus]|uniref:Uncharacterized protein n=1 Tax=Dibothriocephalus latus TaxID=60516 RepID=A0A3P7RNH0_DIBLA|nr:unnamed protein product [Dibothriocephalus latus]